MLQRSQRESERSERQMFLFFRLFKRTDFELRFLKERLGCYNRSDNSLRFLRICLTESRHF